MANIIDQLDKHTCPNVSGFKLGTWLQTIYTATAGGASASSTALLSLQSGRALLNEMRTKYATNLTTIASLVTLGKELRTDSTTNAAAVTNLKTAFLNHSTNKARCMIGSTNSAHARANATLINGVIAGVFYACAATECAFSTPTDSFAPAATRISRCFTLCYTAAGTLTHSTGATISGTATAPTPPRPVANTFPVGVMKIVLKAGTSTRFNGGTTTLGAPGLTTTFTDYSFLPGYIGDHADAVAAAAPGSAATAITSAAMSTPGDITILGSVPSLDIEDSAITW